MHNIGGLLASRPPVCYPLACSLSSSLYKSAQIELEKALLIAKLLKAEGDIYEEQGNPNAAYESYLISLNLLLEIVLRDDHLHDLHVSPEIEDLLGKLDAYQLPPNTRHLLLRYYEQG